MTANKQLTVMDVCEGFHLSLAVKFLYTSGVLKKLDENKGKTLSELLESFNLHQQTLKCVLDYVASRTDFVKLQDKHYVLTYPYNSIIYSLAQYLGAYSPNSLSLESILNSSCDSKSLVDRTEHSKAFDNQTTSSIPELPHIIRKFEVKSLLDIGCGTATLLIELAQEDPEFTGIGIDFNITMCNRAQKRIHALSLDDRITIHHLDFENFNHLNNLDIDYIAIQAISMTSLLNEFFSGNTEHAINALKQLGNLLPGRIIFVADYYGRLGTNYQNASQHGLLHDYIQAISGQGIPPSNLDGWQLLYESSGCALIHAYENDESHFPYFIHLIRCQMK